MQLTKFNPRRDFWTVNSLFNNFFDQPYQRGLTKFKQVTPETWNPKVDIYDNKDAYEVKAELPGVDKNNIKVDVDGRVLSIKGERKEESEETEKSCYRREMFYGKFERKFTLPEAVDTSKIKAEYKDGILTLNIPKPEEQKPKKITIH